MLSEKKNIYEGFSNFADYDMLKLILAYVLPRKDMKVLAKKMISKFGSLKQVFDADTDELKEVKDIPNYFSLGLICYLKMGLINFWKLMIMIKI